MSNTGLTTRELAVLSLKAAGFQDKQIARELGVCYQTVKNHVGAILIKLEVCNATAAVVVAIRDGDLDPDMIEVLRRESCD